MWLATSTLMMEAEVISETWGFSSTLTRLMARENFSAWKMEESVE
jgi:hypothetical protein